MKGIKVKKLFLLVLFLAGISLAQTNSFSKQNVYETNSSFVVDLEFTLDSLAGMATKTFELPAYVFDFTNQPISFKKKLVSTYGSPKYEVFFQGVYGSETDTVSIDTVSAGAVAETESDSIGVLTLNTWRAPKYKVFVRCLNADINSGKLVFTFPKVNALPPKKTK